MVTGDSICMRERRPDRSCRAFSAGASPSSMGATAGCGFAGDGRSAGLAAFFAGRAVMEGTAGRGFGAAIPDSLSLPIAFSRAASSAGLSIRSRRPGIGASGSEKTASSVMSMERSPARMRAFLDPRPRNPGFPSEMISIFSFSRET